ncbi:hypothetical protein Ccrd_004114 [Cynara cardunculus var. scolymus]|uniref:Uncharacterized protein n=1 Tax=Cynara cardunculus var. scolymus TaxID=59895 RepID=A0A103XN86_CYNCS|nr:hypothetical protein Ccrd_004114 [Cynara cardunculus var. scolymus]
MCNNVHDDENDYNYHHRNTVYDHACIYGDAHHTDEDVIDDDDDDGDYDYAPAASMEGDGNDDSHEGQRLLTDPDTYCFTDDSLIQLTALTFTDGYPKEMFIDSSRHVDASPLALIT